MLTLIDHCEADSVPELWRSSRGRPRVAVLSDDRSFLHVLRTLLGEIGIEIGTHAEACAPVRFIARFHPDLVVLDVCVTHERNAWPVLHAICEHPLTARTPVLVCSATDWLLAEHDSLLQHTAASTWTQPFDLGELVYKIHRLLRQSGVDCRTEA
jgi:DNA-binding response OmpR family regulator